MNITNITLMKRLTEVDKKAVEILLTFEIDGVPYDYHTLAPREDEAYQEVLARGLLSEMVDEALVRWKRRDAKEQTNGSEQQ